MRLKHRCPIASTTLLSLQPSEPSSEKSLRVMRRPVRDPLKKTIEPLSAERCAAKLRFNVRCDQLLHHQAGPLSIRPGARSVDDSLANSWIDASHEIALRWIVVHCIDPTE
jgi:hypothetical protein